MADILPRPKPDRRKNLTLRALVARGLALLDDDERQALVLERHRRQHPHCTCNECIELWHGTAVATPKKGPTHE